VSARALRARIGALPGLRRVRDHPAVVRAFAVVYRSRLVEGRPAFVWREWRRAALTGRYRLRGTSIDVLLRHGTSDLDILEEVFGLELYALPREVEDVLGDARLRVVDLGGHVGLFGAWLLAGRPTAWVTAVEPDPANAALLLQAVRAYAGPGRWQLVTAAAATAPGLVSFAAGGLAESALAPEDGALQVHAIDAFELMRDADLVKIDIEGGEWALLRDPRLATLPARAVALEYHPQHAPSADFRAAAHELLREAGYETREIPNAPIGAGMLWAWRGSGR
jgi:FkbM family methyltransferase